MSRFDYVVVGGGSAGCIAAAELADLPDAPSVLLLECGRPAEDNPETLRASGYKHAFANDDVIWERFSEPQKECSDLRVFMGSGRGMGGSGSVNGMVYTRGSILDYAEWPNGWQWEDILPSFRAIEEKLRPHKRPPTEFTEACIRSAEEAGFRFEEDLNDGELGGVIGYEWMNYEDDDRRSSYVAFLKEGPERPNLEIATGARAHRLELSTSRKIEAVVYEQGGEMKRAEVGDEVLLCAGALETPKLLMLSGIGPAQSLRALGIPVVLDAPEIGAHLHDHPNVPIFLLGQREADAYYPQLYSFHRANPHSDLPKAQSDTCYVFWPARSSMRQAMTRLLPSKVLPQALYDTPLHGLVRSGVDLAFRSKKVEEFINRMYGIVIILGKPKSRGRLTLRSANVWDTARLDPAYYSHPEDMETMLRGVRLARKVASGASLREWGNKELMPGAKVTDDDALATWIGKNTITTYHYAGTARMGTEETAPTDTELALRGVQGVRIADASAIPTTPVSALNAPSMLVGYRAARFVAAARKKRKAA